MSRAELVALYSAALSCLNQKSGSLVEIGSYLGASSCFLGLVALKTNSVLYCVDTWENQTMPEGERDTLKEFSKNTLLLASSIRTVRKNSKDLVPIDLKLPVSFGFIDGDHSYEMVKIDFENIDQWISFGGIVAFHDSIHFRGVSKVIGEALATGNYQFVTCVDNLFILKKVTKEYFIHQ